MPHHLKPSDLMLVGDVPLRGVFGDRSRDLAGALIVLVLKGFDDRFRPMLFAELCAAFDVWLAHPTSTPSWLMQADCDPDFEGLARSGFATWVGEEPKGMVFTDKGMAALRRSPWNRPASQPQQHDHEHDRHHRRGDDERGS